MAIKSIDVDDNIKWWSELKHGGMLISPPLVEQYFGNIDKLSTYKYNQLRDKYISFESTISSKKDIAKTDTEVINKWVDYVIQVILEHNQDNISKGKYINDKYKLRTILGQSLTPDRVIFSDASRKHPILLVSIQKTDKIGVGKDRRKYTEFIDLLRGTGVKLGILTNGVQFRICYAGIDYDAWTEWDASMWFIEAEWRKQLDGFIALVGKKGLELEDNNPKLKRIIEESRNKQSEISDILGQQIREAVEILINQLDITVKTKPELLEDITKDIDDTRKSDQQINNALYQAASRIIMRIVVLLFAEARNLLPTDIIQYNESYGIEGLYEQLYIATVYDKLRVKNQYSAWRRIISLFNLVHKGSSHYVVPLQGYGGILFERGNLKSEDEILQCIAIFESTDFKLSDYQVYEILGKIKIGRLKVKQGNKNVWVKGLVDFADLKTEYIGIMYEGLLDYSLKRATETLIVINIGKQPILPLSNLEKMTDKEINELIKKLKEENKNNNDGDNEKFNGEDDEIDRSIDNEDYEFEYINKDEDELISEVDKKVRLWGLRVVKLQKKVKKTKSMDESTYNKLCIKEADKLIIKILHENEYYIASQGGTRKGSGTFYTKPGLAIPTTQRTLKPLLYEIDSEGNDIPKTPKEILQIKVCDPTCGSGTFLVAATDYITDALTKSILYNNSYKSHYGTKTKVLPFGKNSSGKLDEELIPVPPDDPKFEEFLRVYLRRHVVERCIYGVDINPMAVELAKLSLWINTMNEKLPFTFLDHKIKVGNGLVGTWIDQFKHYPILAWSRDGGDKDHSNGVNYKQCEWTNALKDFMEKKVKTDMIKYIESIEYNNMKLYGNKENISNKEIEEALENSRAILEEFHSLPISAGGMRLKEELYKNKILNNEYIKLLKEAFDEWCSLWFWSADELDDNVPVPTNFHNISDICKKRVKRISREIKFFHWELEFPEVFTNKDSGFTAILGNPPWDIAKPSSDEFFLNYNPMYKSYEKQQKLEEEKKLFKLDTNIEREWLNYVSNFKSLSNWVINSSRPYGDGKYDNGKSIALTKSSRLNTRLMEVWRNERFESIGYMNKLYPFIHQGSADLNTYKLFLEKSFYILRNNSRLGMIVPSGIYSDKGTEKLRKLFIETSKWEWLFSFVNKNKIFNIGTTNKFCVVIMEKGKSTSKYIKASFMRKNIEDWETCSENIINYYIEDINKFSPENKSFVEIQNQNEMNILSKIYNNGVLLGNDDSWGIKYSSEFHMTSNSNLFINNKNLIENGYKINEYGFGINKEGKKAYPLYQGSMINQFDFCNSKYLTGSGANAKWEKVGWDNKNIKPQFYILEENYIEYAKERGLKCIFRDTARNTDKRTAISTSIVDTPTGNTLPLLIFEKDSFDKSLLMPVIFNSYVYDYIARFHCSGMHLNYFVIKDTSIPKIDIINSYKESILKYSSRIIMPNEVFASYWLKLANKYNNLFDKNWYSLWALTEHERLRIRCILDAVVAEMYGLGYEDLAWILKDDETDPKGFWRVDKDKPVNMRHTTLTLVAFKRLKEIGIAEFLKEDWQLPKDVAEAIGPRFLDWQFEKTVEESWEECDKHARAFLGDEEYEKFIEELGLGGLTHA